MDQGQPDAGRLTAEMASFRLLVLAAVREYIATNGGSPSYGEIANRLGSNRERVRKAVYKCPAKALLINEG